MRHCSKNAYLSNFKTTAAETANTPARFARNTDAFKMPLKRLADATFSIQISLKAKKSQTFARARACATKTGARTR